MPKSRERTEAQLRIKAISAKNIEPIKSFQVSDLSDVVVIAGPNGVGKSRLLNWLLNFFQNLPSDPDNWAQIEATSETEIAAWGKASLDTRTPGDNEKLLITMRKGRVRSAYQSSLLNFESDRSITQVQPFNFSWDYSDPYLEQIGWNFGFSSLTGRFQDTVHSIFRKVRSRREAISLRVDELATERKRAIQPSSSQDDSHLISFDLKDFPDPIEVFKDAFSQLLAPKKLLDPDPKRQQLFFTDGRAEYPLVNLSSGEREVVNVVFDFLLRNPSDCVVIFDEPELHLHPELSYRLLQTLKTAGTRNQFVFCTHSAEIISASLDNSVLFVTPSKGDGSNQAVAVREDDATHRALKLIGQSIGVVSLGKRIVLVEGNHGSLDKETYGAILRGQFPSLVLVPSGGKELIQSFSVLIERVLDQSVWGVDFFMLCDRDAVPATRNAQELESAAKQRLRVLKRYHLENYFLDEQIIAKIFEPFEKEDSWLRDPIRISNTLKTIARDHLSYAAALIVSAEFRERVGNLDIMPSGCHKKTADELCALIGTAAQTEGTRIGAAINLAEIKTFTQKTMNDLESSLASGEGWKASIPGRTILSVFCSNRFANMDFGRFKTAYIKIAGSHPSKPFSEIEEIFASFASLSRNA